MEKYELKGTIIFSESKIKSAHDILNRLFEYIVFYRWIYFKNRPRGNFLLIRSFFAVGTIFGLYYWFFSSIELVIAGVDLDPVLALLFAATIGYWVMSNVFHKKSAFCTTLYNTYLVEEGLNNKKAALLLENSLATHLLTVDLWAHRTFEIIFCNSLNKAIKFKYKDDQEKINHFSKNMKSGNYTIRETRELLQAFQSHIINNM